MVLRLVKSIHQLTGIVGLGLLGLVGCGSEAGPSQPSTSLPGSEVDGAELQTIGVVTGSFRDGHLSLGPIQPTSAAPGVSPQGFGPFTQTKVSFDTAAGDGVQTGTCSATQYCGTVSLTNNTGLAMQNTFVEITDYFNVAPVGSPISWAGTPFAKSNAYASVFVNSGSVEAADYGSFTVGQAKSLEFKFNIGAATNFDFHAKVYATFFRTAVSNTPLKKSPTVDACASGGTFRLQGPGADDSEMNMELPFPFTAYDLTYDRAVIGANGYVLLYNTGGTPRSLTQNNTSLSFGGFPQGFYVFWDDLAYDAGDGVCTLVSGTKPNRTFTVTWKNAKIATVPQAAKVWSSQKVTYSLVMQELVDTFSFNYMLPSGGVTDGTRGITATTGYYVVRSGKELANTFSFNSLSPYIPALTTDYPARYTAGPVPLNP